MERNAQIAIEDFARFLGLPVNASENAQTSFSFSESGRLTFTAAPDGQSVLLTLSKAFRPGVINYSKLIELAGYDPVQRITLQASINRDNQLVLSSRSPQRELTVQKIIQIFDFMKSRQKAI